MKSPNNNYIFWFSMGELGLSTTTATGDRGTKIWSSGTSSDDSTNNLVFQSDGNLVLYDSKYPKAERKAIWASNTMGKSTNFPYTFFVLYPTVNITAYIQQSTINITVSFINRFSS
jgi:hypothetical protein